MSSVRHASKYSLQNSISQQETEEPATLNSAVTRPHPLGMADDIESRLRGFLIAEAKKRKGTWWLKSTDRPNGKRIAADLGLSQPTISRILTGDRQGADGVSSPKRRDPYQISPKVASSLMSFFGFATYFQLYEVLESSEPHPPVKIARRRRAAPK